MSRALCFYILTRQKKGDTMDKSKVLKYLGMATSLAGFGISLLSDWIADQQLDEKITKAVKEQVEKITR